MPYNNIPPALASYFAGQDQTQGLLDAVQKRAQMQQQMDQSSQMNPLVLQQRQLENEGLGITNQTNQARLPGVGAEASSKVLDYQNRLQTNDSDVATHLSQNDEVQQENKQKGMERAQKFLMNTAAQISQVAPPLRASAFQQMAQESGIKLDHPMTKQFLNKVIDDPEGFPAYVQQYADNLGKQAEAMSAQARSAKEVANIHAAAERDAARTRAGAEVQSAGIHAGATIRAAELGLEGKKASIAAKNKGQNILEQLKNGQITPDKAMTAAITNYQLADTEGDRNLWSSVGNMVQGYVNGKPQAGHIGDPVPSTDANGNVTLTPKAVAPLFPNGKPKGTGTAADPIKLD